jgi:hypothetical protein
MRARYAGDPPDLELKQDQQLISKLQNVTEAARLHLSNREFRELEELLTEYKDIFAVKTETTDALIKCITAYTRETSDPFDNYHGGCP